MLPAELLGSEPGTRLPSPAIEPLETVLATLDVATGALGRGRPERRLLAIDDTVVTGDGFDAGGCFAMSLRGDSSGEIGVSLVKPVDTGPSTDLSPDSRDVDVISAFLL